MRARTSSGAVFCLAVLFAADAAAQGRPIRVERDPAPMFRSGVEKVSVQVSVRDRRGRIVRDLSRADFRLQDSGFGRAIDDVFASDSALSIAVLVDISGSMAIDGNIARARRAVDALVELLQPGRDELALFTFDSVLREVAPFTSALDRIGAVDLPEAPYGRTSLYDAVADAATLVARRSNPHRALLVVTDGVDNGSVRTVEHALGIASAIAVPVHVVTVGGPLDRRDGIGGAAGDAGAEVAASLADLAGWTGGTVHATGTAAERLAVLGDLLAGLRYRYVLTFEPGFRRGWHPIRIRTADDNLVVHARRGYVAGRARLKW